MSSGFYKDIAGIIGGVGPEATNYFTSLLVKLHRHHAMKDQDHIPYFLFNNPQIPDRTEYLLKQSDKNPLPEIIKTGLALKRAGATFLVMPCNTAHAFAKEIEQEVGLPFINMIDETVRFIQENYRKNAQVGILATTGTIRTQLYQQSFKRIAKDITVHLPNEKEQKEIMNALYDIKSISVNEWNTYILQKAAKNLYDKGASIIVLGCTEIPLAIQNKNYPFITLDPMEILAKKVINRTIVGKPKRDLLHSFTAKYLHGNIFARN